MKIRWKLLIVFLSISLVPMMIMRLYNQRGMHKLGEELATRTQDVLIQKANFELKMLVDEHATILQRDRALINLALKVQASELEKRFLGEKGQLQDISTPQASKKSNEQIAFRHSDKHFKVMGGRSMPLSVSYDGLGDLNILRSIKSDRTIFNKLSSMVPVYRSLADAHPEHILWQLTAFEDGTQAVYPAIERYPMRYNAYQQEWYKRSKNENRIFWSRPVIEPFTRQLSFVVSFPLVQPDGKFVGATAIVVPVDAILHVDEHIKALSEKFTALLVRSESNPESKLPGIIIVAREQELGQRHGHWQVTRSDEQLIFSDEKSINQIAKAISEDITGVSEVSYKGNKSIAAYGTIDKFGLALMLIVNKVDIVAESENMRTYVLERVIKQINFTKIILISVFLIVICLAFFLSRSVSINIQKLVNAVRQIASGNFKIRTQVKSNDEIGELSRAFDRMIPELEERIEMKQALDVAMQVQKNLLPQKMPAIEGLDIAAKSIYCDETGGDFYDFLDFCCREKGVIGMVVGDVSGHGISAAMLMASVRAFLRCRVTQPGTTEQIINDVNRLLTKDVSDSGEFVTLFYMEINHIKKEIKWVRAGHDPAWIYNPSDNVFEELRGKGMLMGADGDINFEQNVLTGLTSGQVLFIGTDGIWETHNSTGEMFGKQRLMELIRENSQSTAETILEIILEKLNNFKGDLKQEDDVTLVVVKVE
jgi:sigma-B regulation protein RsbU (phosphoserine phosphatase)